MLYDLIYWRKALEGDNPLYARGSSFALLSTKQSKKLFVIDRVIGFASVSALRHLRTVNPVSSAKLQLPGVDRRVRSRGDPWAGASDWGSWMPCRRCSSVHAFAEGGDYPLYCTIISRHFCCRRGSCEWGGSPWRVTLPYTVQHIIPRGILGSFSTLIFSVSP